MTMPCIGCHPMGRLDYVNPDCPAHGRSLKTEDRLPVYDSKWILEQLEELRQNPTEDTILDLMDRVSGWTSPHLLPNPSGRESIDAALKEVVLSLIPTYNPDHPEDHGFSEETARIIKKALDK